MDRPLYVVDGQNLPLVLLEFLQGGCKSADYNVALATLKRNLSINCNQMLNDDGDIECDGHMSHDSIALDLADIRPDVNLNVNHAQAAVVQQVAADLRQIAARFEHDIIAQATQNLQRNMKSSPYERWAEHLSREVESAIGRGVCLQDLPQERVIMAVSLTLVKGVCERAPHMLQSLFHVALQFISYSGRR
ncbi:BH3 interacting domain death agonist [Synchiropus splendidus]|uniref:BH3 interacting domain death agonist n=1 Tax=Synchiropus splendidus TaxID=270530 RepID=UPI00237E1AC6|nr:BH3 interacting domain death agonist [Synchiropus splendidus]